MTDLDGQALTPEQKAMLEKATVAYANALPGSKETLSYLDFEEGYRAALAAREERPTDSLSDFTEESLEALRDLMMPLEDFPSSDRLLRLIDSALEAKRRGP